MTVRALWLDYQRAPASSPLPGLMLLAVALAAGAWLVVTYVITQDQLMAAQHRIATAKQALAHRQLPDQRSAADATQTKQLAERLTSKSAGHWERLFTELESALDDSVTLLTLEPGASEITLSGEAKNFAAAGAFARRLDGLSSLSDVRLVGHETVKENPQRPVRFSLAANWRTAP